MKRFALASLLLFILSAVASAQTLSPLNAEFGKKVKGEFSFTNEGFSPLAVTFEVMTFRFVNGQGQVTPLDSGTHIKLSEYSARIPAKQVHTVFYDGKCDTYPCAFIILTSMVAGHLDNGVAVVAHLGHVAYACEKQKGCRQLFLSH